MKTNNENEQSNVQKIIQYTIDKNPSKIKDLVHKEITSRIMSRIEDRKSEIGVNLFGN